MEYKIPLRIVVIRPPAQVNFCMENGSGELVSVVHSTGRDITFDFEATVTANRRNGEPNFTGPQAEGTSSKRFFYVNIGTLAGQADTQWERRAKVWISNISWNSVMRVAADPTLVLMARYNGTNGRGEPSYATVELLDGGWIITSR